jgi:hypothetical protein
VLAMPGLIKTVFLIIFDLVSMLLLLLFLTYFGMSHVFLLLSGMVFLFLCLYDSRTGRLSDLFILLFSLPAPVNYGRLNWIPALLSLLLVIYSMPILFEHGLVNTIQRSSMQGGLFPQFALWAGAVTAVIIALAVFSTVSNRGKR